ncbi:MAG TPA: aminoglycoside phosphotransferase family protein [Candidatus Sulfotelmatobacter sp.]|nr:aminoglycoside phosphotransferase family protein [Candidatus Sulfotelmatobacter sp.]
MGEIESHILDLLRRDQLASPDALVVQALGGGVSSDVFLIQDGERQFVVKQALPQLKVKDLWQADTSRNRVEFEFLNYLGEILPDAVPSVISAGEDYFAMEYLGADYRNWKDLLLRGECQRDHAVQAAKILATLHRSSFGRRDLAARFDTTGNFHQLRTDPYLLTTGARHPELREQFEQEAARLESTRECLVHGDCSPKNMMIGDGRFVLLDCEVAWYGDPSFDLGFLINHLLLKSLYHAPADVGLRRLIDGVLETYFSERKMDAPKQHELDARTAKLLLMLMLARIDGKSAVEYLASDGQREFVREFVRASFAANISGLQQVVDRWFTALPISNPL